MDYNKKYKQRDTAKKYKTRPYKKWELEDFRGLIKKYYDAKYPDDVLNTTEASFSYLVTEVNKENKGLGLKTRWVCDIYNSNSTSKKKNIRLFNAVTEYINSLFSGEIKEIGRKIADDITEKTNERTFQKFLQIINKTDSSRYAKIDDLYVPPKEYNEIVNTLSKNKIVFISGSPEFGKTFTSVKLLWEWYKKGYEPHWKEVFDEEDRFQVRKNIRKIEDNLKPGHIHYFEDPFGRVKYENNGGELEIMINQVLTSVQSTNDVFVIITSREQVFEEFKKRSLSKLKLEQFEKKLHIISPSYSSSSRTQMLLNYAELSCCKWLDDQGLKNFVTSKINQDRALPSPLSINNFSIYSKNDSSKRELELNLKKASEEIGRQFAKEIIEMHQDEQIFFSCMLIKEDLDLAYLFDNFHEKKNGSEKNSHKYKDIIWKYKDKIIELRFKGKMIDYDIEMNWDNCESAERTFIHPSYYEARKFLTDIPFFKNIVREIILELGEYQGHNETILRLIIENYNYLSTDIKNILSEKSEDPANAYSLALSIIDNYQELPLEIKKILPNAILKVHRGKALYYFPAMGLLMMNLAPKYFNMPLDVQQIVIEHGGDSLGTEFINNWNCLTIDEKNLFFFLVNDDRVGFRTIQTILINYYLLPDNVTELIYKIIRKPYTEPKEYSYFLIRKIIYDNNEFQRFPFKIAGVVLSYLLKNDFTYFSDKEIIELVDKTSSEVKKRIFSLDEINAKIIYRIRLSLEKEKLFYKVKDYLKKDYLEKCKKMLKKA